MPYVRDSFWSGRQFTSFEAMVEAARAWCADVAPRRRHRVLELPVGEVFRDRERPALLPLPERPFAVFEWRRVKVHPDCHVAIDRALYSVPWQHVGKTLQAKIGAPLIELFDGAELVKTHLINARGRRITDPADLPPDKVAFLMRTPAWCRKRAAEAGASGRGARRRAPRRGQPHAAARGPGPPESWGHVRHSAPGGSLRARAHRRWAHEDGAQPAARGARSTQPALPAATAAAAFLHGPEAITGEVAR